MVRRGEEKLVAVLQESLHLATRRGAAKPADFTRVIVDTTVRPKAITFPTDAKLLQRARERRIPPPRAAAEVDRLGKR
jgi:IS5 family transposase